MPSLVAKNCVDIGRPIVEGYLHLHGGPRTSAAADLNHVDTDRWPLHFVLELPCCAWDGDYARRFAKQQQQQQRQLPHLLRRHSEAHTWLVRSRKPWLGLPVRARVSGEDSRRGTDGVCPSRASELPAAGAGRPRRRTVIHARLFANTQQQFAHEFRIVVSRFVVGVGERYYSKGAIWYSSTKKSDSYRHARVDARGPTCVSRRCIRGPGPQRACRYKRCRRELYRAYPAPGALDSK